MQCKCEIAVNEILPYARSVIARKLVDTYGFSQTNAAKRMGISQPAISQYRSKIRGRRACRLAKDPRFTELAERVAKGIAEGSIRPAQVGKEMCRFCALL
jgi:predicted transcriptional regulator